MTSSRPAGAWPVVGRRGSAGELHARPVASGGRMVEVMAWRRTALVLGSTQPLGDADRLAVDAIGADLVRRRSGGGAVLLRPGHDLWVDVTIPRADRLWHDDVAVSFLWLGRVWAAALAGLGVEAAVHPGPSTTSPWSRRVCFAGMGAGEVTVGGRKVVGLSQRRTRDAARYQCLVPGSWDAAELLALLALDEEHRDAGLVELAAVAAGTDLEPAALTAAFVAALPD
ncbi:MAG: hypothetical protein AB7O29_14220 [Acidimicrobiia bacterium]